MHVWVSADARVLCDTVGSWDTPPFCKLLIWAVKHIVGGNVRLELRYTSFASSTSCVIFA